MIPKTSAVTEDAAKPTASDLMTEMLTRAILDGQRDKIFDQIVDKLLNNQEYEVFIHEHINKCIL